MVKLFYCLAFWGAILALPCWAQDKSIIIESPECRSIILNQDGTWTFANKTQASALSGAKIDDNFLSLTQVKAEPQKYIGQFLRLKGKAKLIIQSLFLQSEKDDENPLEIDVSGLSDALQKKALTYCEADCDLLVEGILVHEKFQTRDYWLLKASALYFR